MFACVAAGVSFCGCGGASATERGAEETVRPVLVFGQTGLGPGDFSYPRAIAIAPDDRVFVIDKAARVQRFSSDGRFETGWQMPDWSAGKPTGATVGPDGNLYVADTHYYRIVAFDREGREVGRFGVRGTGPGEFLFTTDVAFDRDGCLYVSEYGGNDRVSKFSPDRKFLFSFGGADAGEASLLRPQSICFDTEQTLWVADACNHRLCRFSRDGRLLSQVGRPGAEPGALRYPYAVRVAADGTLFVCEYGNNRVQRFAADGRSLGTWGGAGREPGRFAYPWSLDVARDGRVFVVDAGNNRVQVFKR